MSTFSGDIGREEEDGGGWEGLVPDREERRERKLAKLARDRAEVEESRGQPRHISDEINRQVDEIVDKAQAGEFEESRQPVMPVPCKCGAPLSDLRHSNEWISASREGAHFYRAAERRQEPPK